MSGTAPDTVTLDVPVFNKYEFLVGVIGLAQTLPGRIAKGRETKYDMSAAVSPLREQLRHAYKERPDADVLENIAELTRSIAQYEGRLEAVREYVMTAVDNGTDMLEVESPERDEYIAVLTSRLCSEMLGDDVSHRLADEIAVFNETTQIHIWTTACNRYNKIRMNCAQQ